MPKYLVEFQQDRKVFFSGTVAVMASSEEEARKLAEKKVDSIQWHEFDDELIETNIIDVTNSQDL